MDPPILLDVKSRMMLVTWQHPLKCNGVITHYNIYQHGHLSLETSGNVTNCTVIHLHPYTAYKFQVEACTSKGCSLSPESQTVWTLPDAPEDIPSPELFSDTPTSVIVSWQPPKHPNGLVENFTIDRRIQGEEEVTTLVTLPRNHSMRFIDKTSALSPWTKYEYRVLMSTLNGGTNSSAWVEVTTRPSRPAGVQPPMVRVLGPNTAEVRHWVFCLLYRLRNLPWIDSVLNRAIYWQNAHICCFRHSLEKLGFGLWPKLSWIRCQFFISPCIPLIILLRCFHLPHTPEILWMPQWDA